MTDRISSIPDARECIGAMVNERLAMSRYTSRPMQCSLFVMAAIALIPFSGQIAGAVTTCKLVPVPFSEPDILNPGRGYYNELWWEFFWVDINKQQSPADSGYFYNRYLWCDLEPRQDDYQFAMIDKDIARAKAAGRKFGFRVMPHNNNLTGVPAYIAALGGTWVDGGFWPKWDNSFVIERMDKLYAALSAKYEVIRHWHSLTLA